MAITATPELKNMLVMAARIGCAPDQMAGFHQARYMPLPRALEFHAAAREADTPGGPDRVGYGGPRGEAKSHAVMAQVGLDDCQRFPGSKWLYLRKIQKSAGEQLEDLVGKIFGATPHEYLPSKGLVNFSNSSKIVVGGYRSENEIDGYLGIEYDGIVAEDATTLSKSKIDRILGSLRSSKPGWRPRMYLPANPGGVGHAWYKKMLFDPWQQSRETDTRFIYARRGDNPFINETYRKYLDSLTGWLRRAWRDGDFSIAAGQFFTPFDANVHVIKPFELTDALWWGALDYGFVHWTMAGLFARQGENIYLVDEYAARRKLVKPNAQGIHNMLDRNGLNIRQLRSFPSGHDVFAPRERDDESTTTAKEYQRAGIKLSRANTDRVNGAAQILQLLGNPNPAPGEDEIEPRFYIFDRCHKIIEQLPEMQHDPNRGEDVLKVDCDSDTGEGGDDAYDYCRYGLMELFKKSRGVLVQGKASGWNP